MAAAPVALPLLLLAALAAAAAVASATTVAYNDRAVVIDGQRRIILSGSIHYPRSTPQVNEILMRSIVVVSRLPSQLTWLATASAILHACSSASFVDRIFISLLDVINSLLIN
jgi:hypothetical protein